MFVLIDLIILTSVLIIDGVVLEDLIFILILVMLDSKLVLMMLLRRFQKGVVRLISLSLISSVKLIKASILIFFEIVYFVCDYVGWIVFEPIENKGKSFVISIYKGLVKTFVVKDFVSQLRRDSNLIDLGH